MRYDVVTMEKTIFDVVTVEKTIFDIVTVEVMSNISTLALVTILWNKTMIINS
jgi:hypothetical protein